MNNKNTLLGFALIAAILFGELREVGFSFWVGICLIVLSVVLQTYSVIREKK